MPSHALQVADERLYAQKYSRRGESDRTMAALLEALSDPRAGAPGAARRTSARSRSTSARCSGCAATSSRSSSARPSSTTSASSPCPDEILHKPGPLDEREWAFVRQHTIVGERILRASPALRSVATVVRSSHENWDGSGYPDGLAGEEIPLAVADHPRLQRLRRDDLGAPVPRRRSPIDEALNELMRLRRHRVRPERRARPRRAHPRRAGSRTSRVARRGHTATRGPVAQWIERQTSNLRAEVRLLPGPPVFMRVCVAPTLRRMTMGPPRGPQATCEHAGRCRPTASTTRPATTSA